MSRNLGSTKLKLFSKFTDYSVGGLDSKWKRRPDLRRSQKGFTLIELLIVVTIIGILVVISIWSITSNLAKSRDSKRKADLDRIKIAFEEYYVDNDTYPPADALSNCGGDELRPYLSNIPCDPRTKTSYCYIYDADNNGQNYRLLSSLEYHDDPIIAKLSCDEDPTYCGYEPECSSLGSRFTYGVSSSNVLVNNEDAGSGAITPTPTPTPTPLGPLPSTNPGFFACSPPGQGSDEGVCNSYSAQNIVDYNCPVTWSDSNCSNYCPTSPSYAWCDQ